MSTDNLVTWLLDNGEDGGYWLFRNQLRFLSFSPNQSTLSLELENGIALIIDDIEDSIDKETLSVILTILRDLNREGWEADLKTHYITKLFDTARFITTNTYTDDTDQKYFTFMGTSRCIGFLLMALCYSELNEPNFLIAESLIESIKIESSTARNYLDEEFFRAISTRVHKNEQISDYNLYVGIGIFISIIVAAAIIVGIYLNNGNKSSSFANSSFEDLWKRTDKIVADAGNSPPRSWFWGEKPISEAKTEEYSGSPDGKRQVQYFEKGRMEVNNPNGDKTNNYYVSNGLIVKEMVLGKIQVGENSYQDKNPPEISIAGDVDDTTGPTYSVLSGYLSATPTPLNTVITTRINRNGELSQDPNLGKYNITSTKLSNETNHSIAGPFWQYLNSKDKIYANNQATTANLFNPLFYITGLPITEPYWIKVKVGGQTRDVLIQLFECRVLTYTPTNDSAWKIGMVNAGQHYFNWRYKV